MRRLLSRVTIPLLVCSLGLPANLLASGRDDAKPAPPPERPTSEFTSVAVAPVRDGLRTDGTFRAAITRATSELIASEQNTPNPVARRTGAKNVRAQYGGGGTGQMITMLVTTVVSLAATVYMIKYMQKQQADEAK